MAGFRVGVVALVKGPNITVKRRVNKRLFLVFELVVLQQAVELCDVCIDSKGKYAQQETKVVFRFPFGLLSLVWKVFRGKVVVLL